MPNGETKEIEIKGVGRFQVPIEYNDEQIRNHIRVLRLRRPEVFRASAPQIVETHEQAKERIRLAGERATVLYAAHGQPRGPGERFISGLLGTEKPIEPSPFEQAARALPETMGDAPLPGGPVIAGIVGGTAAEISEGGRRGAATLAEAEGKSAGDRILAQIKAAGQTASGLVSPIFSPAAIRGAGERLGEGDVAGAVGEVAPGAALLGVAEVIPMLRAGRGIKLPPTTVGTKIAARETAEVAPFLKQELTRMAETSASEVAKRPIKTAIATVAGKPSVDSYVEGIAEAASELKHSSRQMFKDIDSVSGGIFVDVPETSLTPKSLLGAASGKAPGQANISLSEAMGRSQELRADISRARNNPNEQRLLYDQKRALDQAIDKGLSGQAPAGLKDKLASAKELWHKGAAMEDFSDEMAGVTKGLADFESNLPGAGRTIDAKRLVENIKSGTAGRARLEEAVGYKRAQHITEVANLLSKVEDPIGFFRWAGARFYIAPRYGIHTYAHPSTEAFENTGRYILSKGMLQSQSQYYLRNALVNYPRNMARATFWINRYIEQVTGESVGERLKKGGRPAPRLSLP